MKCLKSMICTVMAGVLLTSMVSAAPKETLADKFYVDQQESSAEGISQPWLSRGYYLVNEEYEKNRYPFATSEVRVNATDQQEQGADQGEEALLLWRDGQEEFTWTVNIPETALYAVRISYAPFTDDSQTIIRGLKIDGEYPFYESENIELPRRFHEDEEPFTDTNGDQRTPRLKQVEGIVQSYVYDISALYSEPLMYFLSAGEHTITLTYVSGDMDLDKICFCPPSRLPSYEEYRKGHQDKLLYDGDSVMLEAEEADYRSNATLVRSSDADPLNSPFEYGKVRCNVIGGVRWQNAGQELTWTFHAPKSGMYQIAVRLRHTAQDERTVCRRISIDGEVPFAEWGAYGFTYADGFNTVSVSDEDGTPFEVYLTEGSHTLSMRVVIGPFSDAILALSRFNELLNNTIQRLIKVVGSTPDPNFDYRIEKEHPWVVENLEELNRILQEVQSIYVQFSGEDTQAIGTIETAREEIEQFCQNPEKIPARLQDVISLQANATSWYQTLQQQPLLMDQVYILSPDETVENNKARWWQRLYGTFYNFLVSFTKDYNSVASLEAGQATERLDVWVGYGKEWGELISALGNDDFGRQHNVEVKVNIIPGGVGIGTSPLMLSIISGDSPDIALGTASTLPFELAVRDALVDVSQLSDFAALKERFLPYAFTPFQYKGGIYGVPETMNFPLLFYRVDVFQEYGLTVPDTWDDLYKRVMPILNQNGLDVFAGATYADFLWQHNGHFYSDDLTKSGLDTEQAYQAFLHWTNNYTVYNMPTTVNVFNHLRVGDVPLAVGSLADYISFQVAAPEIYGRWAVSTLPGTYQDDGTINYNTSGGTTNAAVLFKGDKIPLAWEFAQWWTSDRTQIQFAAEIEARVGEEARWLSANTNAFLKQPWDREDKTLFLAAMDRIYADPYAIGDYMTTRQVQNAWTRTVMNGQNPRDSLEQAIRDINRELKRKQLEYQFITS